MPHDFYHLPGYLRLSAENEGGSAQAFVADDGQHRLFVPLIVRPIDLNGAAGGTLCDATSPYGYPSPLLAGGRSEEERTAFLDRALESLLAALQERRVVSLYLRLHPLLPLPQEPFRRQGTLVRHGETVFVDLTQSEEEWWRQTRSQYRRYINHTKQLGYVAEIDQHWSRFDEFFDLYTETMHRVNADPYYFFSRGYFHQLRDALGDRLHLCIVRFGESLACAGTFSEVCGIVQAHLGGRREEKPTVAPTKLMMHFIRCWAKERGNRVFHLGGGLGAKNDSLFFYKCGFSSLRGEFLTWRAVLRADTYQALVAQWPRITGVQTEFADDFFPAYRWPLRRTQAV
ncbi:MAG: GNAT family N-acetyltransferase [Thermoguttaceae bacterium]